VRSPPRAKTIRKPEKVLLVNLIENCCHSLLHDLVFQRRDPERSLPAIRFRDVDSSRRLCSVRSAMNTVVEIGDPFLHTLLILAPCHAVYSRRSFLLQQTETVPQQPFIHMVQKRREP